METVIDTVIRVFDGVDEPPAAPPDDRHDKHVLATSELITSKVRQLEDKKRAERALKDANTGRFAPAQHAFLYY